MAAAERRGALMNLTGITAIVLVVAWLLGVAAPARADDVAEVNRLVKAGQPAAAMARVDELLATRPKDPQLRFLKGVLLADAHRDAEAIEVLTRLNEDYPELAEPYNNLAVLYAGQGRYDKALRALEAAVRANPEYATAYANLGDVHARLALQAWARARALDANDASLGPKIAQMQTLFTPRPVERGAVTP